MVELIDYDVFHTREMIRDSLPYTDDDDHMNERNYRLTATGTCEYHEISKYQDVLYYEQNKPRLPSYAFLKCVPKTTQENLKMKTYIKAGEICKICFEPIMSRYNAILTNCGHSFHSKCMKDYYIYLLRFQPQYDIFCPACRGDVGELTLSIDDLGMTELCLTSSHHILIETCLTNKL